MIKVGRLHATKAPQPKMEACRAHIAQTPLFNHNACVKTAAARFMTTQTRMNVGFELLFPCIPNTELALHAPRSTTPGPVLRDSALLPSNNHPGGCKCLPTKSSSTILRSACTSEGSDRSTLDWPFHWGHATPSSAHTLTL